MIEKIDAGTAIRLLDAGKAVAVDVREPDEYAVGHIPGAKLLPLGEVNSRAAEVLPEKEATWLVYCRTGRRSAEAVQKNLTAHTGNKNNPHAVTAEQVGALASSGGVMSGAISMSGHKIANLAAPADSTDAANKQYVDEHAGARVILGSYVGTGKTGKSNPNQITLAEPFKILCIYGMQSNNYYKSIDGYGNGETSNIIHSSIIPTEYTKGISFGFGYRYSSRDSYGKKSTDGKTFSWYFDLTTPDATSEQLNASGTVYYYYAIV